jgi:hypothetical protein
VLPALLDQLVLQVLLVQQDIKAPLVLQVHKVRQVSAPQVVAVEQELLALQVLLVQLVLQEVQVLLVK